MAAMEPIGRLNDSFVSYGFSPGIEVTYMLSDKIELGVGGAYQLPRRIAPDAFFSYYPVYAVFRYGFQRTGIVELYGLLKAGYAFFRATDAFGAEWPAPGPLTDYRGGFYGGLAIGIAIRTVERSGWGLDFSMETGYSFSGATGTNASGTYAVQLSYQALMANFSLDWRF